MPGIKAPWLTTKVQAVDKDDMFYRRNVYDYYQPSDDLPHRERYVYNNMYYRNTRPIFESKRDGSQTKNWKNFCKKGGWFCMMKKNIGRDTYLSEYSKVEIVNQLLRRMFKSEKQFNNNKATNSKGVEVNVSSFTSHFCIFGSLNNNLFLQ